MLFISLAITETKDTCSKDIPDVTCTKDIPDVNNDFTKASSYFAKVVKRNPPPKMAFEAQMNIAQCYADGDGNSNQINKVLLKMAKETKNTEYLDQIYYALAKVAIADDKDTLVVYYLKKYAS